MIKRILAFWLVLTVTWTTTWIAAPTYAQQSPSNQASYEEAMQRLDGFMELIEELRSHIDRSQFDLNDLLEKLDYQADNIINFVEEEIYFEQYPGLLRGAKGTLMSRSGNALDQSVLLATLLRDAGFEARIVEGRLDPEDAHELLHTSFRTRKAPAGPFDPDYSPAIPSGFKKSLDSKPAPRSIDRNHLYEEDVPKPEDFQMLVESSLSTADVIRKALKSEQIHLGGGSLIDDLESQASLYYWVDYRDGSADSWIGVHPAHSREGDRSRSLSVTPTRFFAEEVPADLLHKIGIEVLVGQKLGPHTRDLTVMSLWERPAANLAGQIVKFMNVPASLANGAAGLPKRDTELFFPVFNGALIGTAFDMAGNVIPAEEAASSYAALFQQLGLKLNKAGGLLSSLGSEGTDSSNQRQLAELSTVTLRVTLSKPSGAKRVIQRHLYKSGQQTPLPDTEQTDDEFLEDFASITQNVSLAILVGSTPPAFFWDRSLNALQGHLRAIKMSFITGTRRDTENRIQKAHSSSEPAEIGLFGLDLNMVAANQQNNRDSIVYRSEPGVISHRWRSQEGGVSSSTVDILSNLRAALRRQGSQLLWAADQLVESGVLETHLERFAVPGQFGVPSGATDAPTVADLERGRFSILRTAAELQSLNVSPDISEEIGADLADGYVVLMAPQKIGPNQDKVAWWRVHPSTGETLGMIGPRLGGAVITERVVKNLLIGAMTWALIAAVEFDACYSVPGEGAEIDDDTLFQVCVACATLTSTLWMIALVSIIWALYTGGASESVAAPTRAALVAQLTALVAQAGCSLASGASD